MKESIDTNTTTNLLTATKVTQRLDISVRTLDNWYRYYRDASVKKPDDMPVLPDYIQSSPRGPRYWKEEDLPALMQFQEWIPHGRCGVMGRTNERFWSSKYRKLNKSESSAETTAETE